MVAELLRFELRYHFRQVTFVASAILFFGFGILIMSKGGFGGSEVHKNAPYVINSIVCFLSLFSIFVSTLMCSNVVLRDETYRMDALLFTTPIRRNAYFGIRFLGLALVVFLVLALSVAGAFAGTFITASDRLGASVGLHFLWPLLIFGLPNVLFCSSIVFSTALFFRNIRVVYMAGVALFILYFVASVLGDSPMLANSTLKPEGPGIWSLLLDPFGMTAFFWETRSWSVLMKNTRLFPATEAFLANRLLWILVSVTFLSVSYRFFRFRPSAPKQIRKKKERNEPSKKLHYRTVTVLSEGLSYHFNAFISQVRLDVSAVLKHVLLLVVLGLWVFLNGMELQETIFHGPYGIRFDAKTGFMVEQLLAVKPALLLLIFYASELLHREKSVQMHGLVFSTPVPNVVLWSAKCATLAVLIFALITANICTGVILQCVAGQPVIDFQAYISLYYYSGLPLFLSALLIVFVQTMISNKYLGMLLSLLVIGISVFGRQFGITHDLLRYASVPDLQYSEMNAFGHYKHAFHLYIVFWSLLAVVLGFLSCGFWSDGFYDSWWQRVKLAGRHWGKISYSMLIASVLLSALTGFYIWQQSDHISMSRGSKDLDWRAAYERQYRRYSGQPQPIVTAIKTVVDLYPDEGKYTVKGTYMLKNESEGPISKLLIGANPEVETLQVSIKGAKAGRADRLLRMYWYQLNKPLQPGQELTMDFSMQVSRSSFTRFNSENSVVTNGTYIELEKYVPFFGYNSGFEISDKAARKEKGLSSEPTIEVADPDYHLVDFETIVSTNSDQYVVTVGDLQKEWTKGGRRYFNYKTSQPIGWMFALSSARYTVKKEHYRGTTFRIFYHPGHGANVPAMMQAMKDAIDYGSAHFSKYPLKQLNLAEIPQYPGSATAYPGVIFSQERINFSTDFRDSSRFHFTYATTAHEVAHQWWANQLMPLNVPGSKFLTESLAKYTELMVTEKRFGKMYLRNYLHADQQLYFALRNSSGEQELPLAKATDQTYVYYQKGGLAMYALREALGEKHINDALRELIGQDSTRKKKASASDLIAGLIRKASPGDTSLIHDYLSKVIIYNNALELLDVKNLTDNKRKLTLKVTLRKTDQTNIKPVLLQPDDQVTIAVFDQPEEHWDRKTKPVYSRKYHFKQKENIVTILVDQHAKIVALDPYGVLLDEGGPGRTVRID